MTVFDEKAFRLSDSERASDTAVLESEGKTTSKVLVEEIVSVTKVEREG
jgi:hypothetical protein